MTVFRYFHYLHYDHAPPPEKTVCFTKLKLSVLVFLVFSFPPSDPQDENKIGIDGIQQFCDDLNLDPASISVLVVAWKFRAATQCEFSKKEFIDGMTELGWAMTSFLYLVMRTVDNIWVVWWLAMSLKVLWQISHKMSYYLTESLTKRNLEKSNLFLWHSSALRTTEKRVNLNAWSISNYFACFRFAVRSFVWMAWRITE